MLNKIRVNEGGGKERKRSRSTRDAAEILEKDQEKPH
jgi:hypothetical protein